MKNAFAADHVAKSPQFRSSPNGSNPATEVDVGGGAVVAGGGIGVGVSTGVGVCVDGGKVDVAVGAGVVVAADC